MSVTANTGVAILSNCVCSLVPNQDAALKAIYRVLKPGGHSRIAARVVEGALPSTAQQAAELYAGCVSGAIQKQVYLELIKQNGFQNITIQKEKVINIPDDILLNHMSAEELQAFRASQTGIYSITVFA